MRCGIIIKVLNRSHLVIINATNLKMSITLMSLYSLGKLLLKFEFNNVLFFIDLIDSIIETSVSRVQNFHQWQCSIIVTCLRPIPVFIFPEQSLSEIF